MGIFIAVLSLIPGDKLPDSPIKFTDLIVHVLMYGTWALVLCLELKKQYLVGSERFSIGMLLIIIIIGIIIEVLQESFIPGRFGSSSDVFANTFGASSVYFLYMRVYNSSK